MYCDLNVNLIPESSEISELKEGVCPVNWAKNCIALAREGNCGQSVMCRDGMTQLLILLEDVTSGKGQPDDLELIKDLCTVISESKGCEISAKAASNVLFSMEKYFDEWDIHYRRKRCTALACKSYYNVYIDPALCTGCEICAKAAPEGAIAGGEGMIHVIKDDSRLKNDEFFALCPVAAIKKAGAIKPRVPQEPVPVGSFEANGGRRRRRR
ncbi:MAG TPA: hypothetical protein GXZ52_04725 [Clostridiales bacterium]|jgi:NADH-quinone oxidoreductase subunit F|nr:hypothetical protein [Clostridiales bacterium]